MEENKEDASSTIVNNNYYGSEPGNEEESSESSISFSQIWHMIKKHWIAVAVCTLLGLAGGVLYGRVIKDPEYEATAQIMVITPTQEDASTNITGSLNVAKEQAAVIYGYMTTTEVREAVCKSLAAKYPDYDITDDSKKDQAMEDLAEQYTVTLPTIGSTSTTSIFVNVTSNTPEKQLSIDLANTVVNVTYDLANGSGSVSGYLKGSIIVTQATTATDESVSNVIIAIVGTAIGLIVGCAFAIIKDLANIKVTSKYELEQLTGIKVIGMIPKYIDQIPVATEEDEDNE